MTRRGGNVSHPSKLKAKSPAAKPSDWKSEDPNLELERQRYENPIASRELLLKHLSEAPEPLTIERLAKRLGMRTEPERDALAKRLAAMVRDGQAVAGPKGFTVAGEAERLVGVVRGRPNGDVLIIPEDGSQALLLVRADSASLMHGDRVEARAVGTNDRGRRVARLIRRIAEAPMLIGGVWHSNGGPGRVEPEDPGIGIPSRSHPAPPTAPRTAITSSSR